MQTATRQAQGRRRRTLCCRSASVMLHDLRDVNSPPQGRVSDWAPSGEANEEAVDLKGACQRILQILGAAAVPELALLRRRSLQTRPPACQLQQWASRGRVGAFCKSWKLLLCRRPDWPCCPSDPCKTGHWHVSQGNDDPLPVQHVVLPDDAGATLAMYSSMTMKAQP